MVEKTGKVGVVAVHGPSTTNPAFAVLAFHESMIGFACNENSFGTTNAPVR
jgi:hypothetical protein